jgi:hypothetical protein
MNAIILPVLLAVAVIILGPILTIWSLNTLFPVLDIPFTLDTWCATVIIGGLFKSTNFYKKG